MSKLVHHRVGGWLPRDQRVVEAWLSKKIAQLEQSGSSPKDWHPVIKEFRGLIEEDAEIFMGFHQMFEQVPFKPPYNKDPTGQSQVRNYMMMLALFNQIIGEAPDYEQNDLVGFPINAILDWPMGTTGGVQAFFNPKVNAQFKKMFDVWASFLTSPASRYVLTTAENGWFGPAASIAIPNFAQTFVCDPSAPYYGFTCWDNFFTRLFRPGVRPVVLPDNNSIVNNACESTVYRIAYNVKARDRFWLKGQPYSLDHMLNNDPLAHQFIGGTVYQAFLSALSYHRWHSPVNGRVVKTVLVPGTYYVESPAMGFANPDGPDPAADNLSQAFITAVAARALIFIQADNPSIGLMCFMPVGMQEVPTCQICVKPGDVIKKGDEIGMFHFGGSTHCLIFRPQTKIEFDPDYPVGTHFLLGAALASVTD